MTDNELIEKSKEVGGAVYLGDLCDRLLLRSKEFEEAMALLRGRHSMLGREWVDRFVALESALERRRK